MKEPAPDSKWELVKITSSQDMAWAYTHETFTSSRGTQIVVWSVFVLQKISGQWKIAMLDWRVGRKNSQK